MKLSDIDFTIVNKIAHVVHPDYEYIWDHWRTVSLALCNKSLLDVNINPKVHRLFAIETVVEQYMINTFCWRVSDITYYICEECTNTPEFQMKLLARQL